MPAPVPYRVVARNIDPHADNAIHDDAVAQQHGFAGALVPGVELFAYASSPYAAAWGEEWLGGGRLDMRFRRPVHDGESLLVEPGEELRLTVGGELRAVGAGGLAAAGRVPDLPAAPLPEVLLAAPVVGPLGSISEEGTVADNLEYLAAVAEPVRLYRERALAHPGLLLRLVNLLLMRNVALGPWVHTASACRLLAPARLPASVEVRGAVREVYERGGHSWVRYDALVLADGAPVLHSDHAAIWRLRGV